MIIFSLCIMTIFVFYIETIILVTYLSLVPEN